VPSSPFNRPEIIRIVGENPSLVRKFELMMQQTMDVLPDQVNLLLTLISVATTSAEDAAGSADAAKQAADDALSVFATLPEAIDRQNDLAALQAQIAAIPDPTPDRFTFYALASEPLLPGALINVWNNAGTPNVRNADADASQYEAIGWTAAGCGAGEIAVVHTCGINEQVSGLTSGARYYLSDTTPGAVTATAPVTVGNLLQPVGIAVSPTALAFTYVPAVVL
jgi:hypothetical protein